MNEKSKRGREWKTRLWYSASLAIVVLSPPGIISDPTSWSCSAFLISTPLTPTLLSAAQNKPTHNMITKWIEDPEEPQGKTYIHTITYIYMHILYKKNEEVTDQQYAHWKSPVKPERRRGSSSRKRKEFRMVLLFLTGVDSDSRLWQVPFSFSLLVSTIHMCIYIYIYKSYEYEYYYICFCIGILIVQPPKAKRHAHLCGRLATREIKMLSPMTLACLLRTGEL